MKITRIDPISLAIPFDHGGKKVLFHGKDWNQLEVNLVRVETDRGIVGWGESFGYTCWKPVQAAVKEMIAPLAIGKTIDDIAQLAKDIQKNLHLFGRYGITIFALSGLEIALWDALGKEKNKPIYELLGKKVRDKLPAYASLFRYNDPDTVAKKCEESLKDNYKFVKLHEIEEEPIKAARETLGDGYPIMLDTNCPWTPEETVGKAKMLKKYDIHWLEEPIFPPEDYKSLAFLREKTGIPIASGENACTVWEFKKMFDANAVDYAQPSLIKVGGIAEMMDIIALADERNVSVMPHTAYFGPGFIATLHIAAVMKKECLIEKFYLKLGGSLHGNLIDPVDGFYSLPAGPGLGTDPDPEVIKEFRVN
jgi:L-alanine-DL-glutamate epimerase-like enolase superfamily enzyme